MSTPLSNLVARWQAAAADLGLEIDVAFNLELPSGQAVQAALRVRDFGATNGMLIFTRFAEVRELADEVVAAGYGFSVLSPPRENQSYTRASYQTMLADWGWSGESSRQPSWLSDQPKT